MRPKLNNDFYFFRTYELTIFVCFKRWWQGSDVGCSPTTSCEWSILRPSRQVWRPRIRILWHRGRCCLCRLKDAALGPHVEQTEGSLEDLSLVSGLQCGLRCKLEWSCQTSCSFLRDRKLFQPDFQTPRISCELQIP